MSDEIRDVTAFYRRAEKAAESYNPGEQVDIAKLMRSAYVHGFAAGLLVAEASSQETAVEAPQLEPIYVAGPGTPIIGHRVKS